MSRWRFVAVPLVVLTLTLLNFAPPAGALSNKGKTAEAKNDLLTLSDFPKGWSTSPNGGGNSIPHATQLAACLGVSVKIINYNPPQANSPEFDENSASNSVTDNVSIFPSQKVASQELDLFSSPKTPRCFAQYFNSPFATAKFVQELGKGTKVGTVTAKWLARPTVAKDATALYVRIPITYKSTSLVISLTTVTFLTNLVGTQLAFTSAGAFPSALEAHLLKHAAQQAK
jgi:hypothetical protein